MPLRDKDLLGALAFGSGLVRVCKRWRLGGGAVAVGGRDDGARQF